MITTGPQLGFSLNPIKALKKVGHGVAVGARATGHGVVATGKFVKKHGVEAIELAVLPVLALNKLVTGPILKRALAPVKARVTTLKERRAKKIAWDRRKSTTPTAAERDEARQWTKNSVKGEIPFGPLLSALAGTPPMFAGYHEPPDTFGEPVTIATILSSIPVLLAIMSHIMGKAAASGEAPAQIAADTQAAAAQVQAIANQAQAQAAADAAGGDPGGGGSDDGGGSGGGGLLPHGLGKQSHLLMTVAVVGGIGIVAYLLLSGKKKD